MVGWCVLLGCEVDDLTKTVFDSLISLGSIRGGVWERLLRVIYPDGHGNVRLMISTALLSGLIQGAFMDRRILRIARQDTFQLGRGDVKANVQKLLAGPVPTTPVPYQVYFLALFFLCICCDW